MIIINEIEEMGGMTEAINSGMPKMRIEESAARRQAKLDSGAEVQVGVNKYKVEVVKDKIDVRVVDNKEVLKKQVARLEQLKLAEMKKLFKNLFKLLLKLLRQVKVTSQNLQSMQQS